MAGFEVKHGKRAMKFAAAGSGHDDLVLALSLAVFGSRLSSVSRDAQMRNTRPPRRNGRRCGSGRQ